MTQRIARVGGAIAAAVALVFTSTSCLLFDYATGARDGCTEYMRTVEFETSNEILRGAWQGIARDYPAPGTDTDLILDLTATFVDEGSYAVEGTFVLGAEAPLTLAGTVDGGCSERFVVGASADEVASQVHDGDVAPASAPPPVRFFAEVLDAGGLLVWTANTSWGAYSDQPMPAIDELNLAIESTFDLGEEGPYGRLVEMVRIGSP